jgi:hypothetical protein
MMNQMAEYDEINGWTNRTSMMNLMKGCRGSSISGSHRGWSLGKNGSACTHTQTHIHTHIHTHAWAC